VANRAKMKKIVTSVAQSASAGKMPSCRESGKVSIVTRGREWGVRKEEVQEYKNIKYKR